MFQKLRELGFETYAEYLRGHHWFAFKEAYSCSGRVKKCVVCGDKKFELHHQTYERLGRERFEDVVPLCPDHHEDVHFWLKDNGKPVEATWEAVAFLRSELEAQRASSDEGFGVRDFGKSRRLRSSKVDVPMTPLRKEPRSRCERCKVNQTKRGHKLCGACVRGDPIPTKKVR